MNRAIIDVALERLRQIDSEGYSELDDDRYVYGELSLAAQSYAGTGDVNPGRAPVNWPWDDAYFKPKGYRNNLVRAAALLVAEIERLDRKERK